MKNTIALVQMVSSQVVDINLSRAEALIREAKSSSFLVPTPAKITKSILSMLDIMNLSLLYPEQYKIADLDYVLDTKKLNDEFKYHPKDTDTEMLIQAYQTYLKT